MSALPNFSSQNKKLSFLNGQDPRFGSLIVFLVALLFVTIITYEFFPGLMSRDSILQYRQAIGDTALTDAHPVILVYLWQGLLYFMDSPGVLLAFHQLLYWFAISLFVCALTVNLRLRLTLLILIGFCPPLIIQSLHLWKDISMAVALAFAVATLLADIRKPHWGWLILTLVALFYATAVRYNGFSATIPLALFTCYRIATRLPLRKWKSLPVSLGLFFIMVIGYYASVNMINTDVRQTYGTGTLIVWDMVAISVAKNQYLLPHYVESLDKSELSLEKISKNFSPDSNVPTLLFLACNLPKEWNRQVIKDWLILISEHPKAYLTHRLRLFRILIGIDETYYPFHRNGINDNEYAIDLVMSEAEFLQWSERFTIIAEWTLYKPWFYLLLTLSVLSSIIIRRVKSYPKNLEEMLAGTVAASGLLTALILFFGATAADYRYMLWVIFAAVLSTVLITHVWLKDNPQSCAREDSGL